MVAEIGADLVKTAIGLFFRHYGHTYILAPCGTFPGYAVTAFQ